MTYFECYADESFLRFLGFTSKELRGGHSFGRSNVCGKLKKVSDSLGLIDEDPFASHDPYLKYLLSGKPVYEDSYIICLMDPKTNNKLIILRPDLEKWALRLAKDMSKDLAIDYGLPSDWKRLHESLMMQKNGNERAKFLKFISDVSNHKAIVKIRELITN